MGKKDKHRPGQSRNDPIFKVVGGKTSKAKNKPREVTTKLKDMRLKRKDNISTKEVTENLDAKLLDLRNKSVSLSGVSTDTKQTINIKPLTGTLSSPQMDIESAVDDLVKMGGKASMVSESEDNKSAKN